MQVPIPEKVVEAKSGFGHTACLTESGVVWTWGTNIKGQLGLNDVSNDLKRDSTIKVKYTPVEVKKDVHNHELPRMVSLACGHSSTMAIDETGILWSWGGGSIGHKNIDIQRSPKRVLEGTDDRRFTKIFANNKTLTLFAPMRTTGIKPRLGPSSGGTEITILGVGFVDTGRQSARFTLPNDHQIIQPLEYDSFSSSFYCKTPSVERHLKVYPYACLVEVTLDGETYITCDEKFLIYSSKLQMVSLSPTCADINGGARVTLAMELDQHITNYF